MTLGILNVDGLKGSLMLLPVLDHTNTPSVAPTSHHDDVADVKLDEVNNLVGLQVELDGVVGLDEWVWVADGAAIIGVQVWDALLAELDRPDLAELELSILIPDRVKAEAALGVIQKPVVLTSLGNRNNVHETSRVGLVSADLSINHNMTLHKDRLHFTVRESIFQSVPQDEDQRQAFPGLVRTR